MHKNISFLKFFLAMTSLFISSCNGSSGSASSSPTTPEEPLTDTTLTLEVLQKCLADSSYSTQCPEKANKQSVFRSFSTSPTDILFVLDESCSMDVIADNLKNGFASLSNSVYPENTKMAVTYMSPAKINEDLSLDFSQPFSKIVRTSSPGYMKLVNQSSIEAYLLDQPDYSTHFPMRGCVDGWFDPTAKDEQGNPCLSAAVQLAPVCTGVEAGAVALEHFMEKLNQISTPLFRPESLVNIIFVSDTHEPGAKYFGRTGAPAQMKSYDELKAAILKNSPDIVSLKFGGILPLPVKDHPYYEGLITVGPIPQNDAEAVVANELFWNYSYLPLIRDSGGVAAHAKSDKWAEVAMSLAQDSRYMSQFKVTIQPTVKIYYVVVNGKILTNKNYNLSADGITLNLRYPSPKDVALVIDIYGEN